MKKLSIIIPVRNRSALLRRCLASVGRQTYRPIQVVIADNGSADDSMSQAVAWGKRVSAPDFEVTVVSEPREGASRARLAGTARANGDVLAFFDSDDTMRPEYSEAIMQPFNDTDDTELVYWRKMLHDTDGTSRPMRFTRHLTTASQVVHSTLSTQGCAVSRRLYLRSGGWNTDVTRWNDWEIGLRYLTSLQGKAACIDRVLVDVYAQNNSITGTDFLSSAGKCETALDAARHNAGKIADATARKQLVNLLAYKQTVLAAHYYREGDRLLAHATLNDALAMIHSSFRRTVLKAVFAFTRRGVRGASLWAVPLLGAR